MPTLPEYLIRFGRGTYRFVDYDPDPGTIFLTCWDCAAAVVEVVATSDAEVFLREWHPAGCRMWLDRLPAGEVSAP